MIRSIRACVRSCCLILIGLAPLGSGCVHDRMPTAHWQMCFTDRAGKVLLADISSDDLFTGNRLPTIRNLLTTDADCRQASYDAASGRLATVESDESGDAVRVYASNQEMLVEFECKPSRKWDGMAQVCLATGGKRVAFVCGEAAVCIADVEGNHKRDYLRSPIKNGESLHPQRVACFSDANGSFFMGFDEEVFLVTPSGDTKQLHTGGTRRLNLCGVVKNRAVGTTSVWATWRIKDIESDALIGIAESGHSYAFLDGVSPCGRYVTYVLPGAFKFPGQRYIHCLETGRRARLRVRPQLKLGSWTERPYAAAAIPAMAELQGATQ